MIEKILIAGLFSIGFAYFIRALPGRAKVQALLEKTWTRGKPLACWTCLAAWGAIVACWAMGIANVSEYVLIGFGGTGFAAGWLNPFGPPIFLESESLVPPVDENVQ